MALQIREEIVLKVFGFRHDGNLLHEMNSALT
jgi:hypothetical protein